MPRVLHGLCVAVCCAIQITVHQLTRCGKHSRRQQPGKVQRRVLGDQCAADIHPERERGQRRPVERSVAAEQAQLVVETDWDIVTRQVQQVQQVVGCRAVSQAVSAQSAVTSHVSIVKVAGKVQIEECCHLFTGLSKWVLRYHGYVVALDRDWKRIVGSDGMAIS
jgi:hypothetical protein